jgi:hypothetical protein
MEDQLQGVEDDVCDDIREKKRYLHGSNSKKWSGEFPHIFIQIFSGNSNNLSSDMNFSYWKWRRIL